MDFSRTCGTLAIRMRLNDRQQALLEELTLHDDPQECLAAIVDRARRRPPLRAAERTPAHRVPGCASQVWLVPEIRAHRCHFRADADSPLVRALVLFLADFFDHATPAEIAANDVDPLEPLRLNRTLSSTRRHGLAAVLTSIRNFAQSNLTSREKRQPHES